MSLPKEFLDAHFHIADTSKNNGNGETFHNFLATTLFKYLNVGGITYLADDYHRDVIEPLEKAGIKFYGSVHMEVIPDTDRGLDEANWVATSTKNTSTKAIIASCPLYQDILWVEDELRKLSSVDRVKGIRWILDCVGKYDLDRTATHLATLRHDGKDFLRGSEGGYDGQVVPDFEKGFALLEKHNLTFDLQCAPAQLKAASELCARHPNIKVVINHLGKPRAVLGWDEMKPNPNEGELMVWREGMRCIAKNKNVYVKISMLGYAIPGWTQIDAKIEFMKSLVRETVEIFGPERCMVASNFFNKAAPSDSGGLSDVGPGVLKLLELIYGFLKDYSEKDLHRIFCTTAKDFYNL